MFERYLTDALTTHFGHVVENIDSDKVRLSAWNGELVLQNLTLRSTALNSFVADCPVEIAYGKVGNLELQLPWKIFGSNKTRSDRSGLFGMGCSVVLTDVNILITPARQQNERREDVATETTPDSIEKRRTQKEKAVQTQLDANLLKRVAESSLSPNRWKWVQDWLAGVFTNLSVKVKDIHIRYEDPGTSMGFEWTINNVESRRQQQYRPPFAIGITLRQFSVQTAENNPSVDPTIVNDGETAGNRQNTEHKQPVSDLQQSSSRVASGSFVINRKIVAADRLSIYWDSNCQLMSMHDNVDHDNAASERWQRYQSCFVALNENDGGGSSAGIDEFHWLRCQHAFLLDPISPSVDLSLVSTLEENLRGNMSSELTDDDCTTDSSSSAPNLEIAPPSTISISLPPCKFTVSRATLEDTTYIRKCFSVWNHAKKGLLSEVSLRRLARLRPLQSPSANPKSWWFYAFEATIYLQRVSRDGRDVDLETSRRRKKGWIGLAEALGRRRRYIELYKNLIEGDDIERRAAHVTLITMEDDLTTPEILAFRIALYEWMKVNMVQTSGSPRSKSRLNTKWRSWMPNMQGGVDAADGASLPEESDDVILSLAHRRRMVEEMSLALERERLNSENQLEVGERFASLANLDDAGSVEASSNPIVWQASLVCRNFAIQVNDQPAGFSHRPKLDISSTTSRLIPVVRLSCAWVLEQSLYQDGSWDVECSLASLIARDLTLSTATSHIGSNASLRTHFPNLIGRKRRPTENSDEDVIIIDKQSHHRSLTVVIRRRLHWQTQPQGGRNDTDRGSTTRTQIRILPMEVVYATIPVEALTRVLATVKTPEMEDDYHRMASVVLDWRERQKIKLLRALAHKHKKIIVDVDVGAPALLIPEDLSRRDSPMLVVDLGQLRIFNDDESIRNAVDFDDQWRVVLTNVHVLCTSISTYAKPARMSQETVHATESGILKASQHLVEPFSLDFSIMTKVVEDAHRGQTDRTRVQVMATLPRLAFNLTSSAIRLFRRMENQWNMRKRELTASSPLRSHGNVFFSGVGNLNVPQKRQGREKLPVGAGGMESRSSIGRVMEFEFSAPLITFLLENDVDGRDCEVLGRSLDSKIPKVITTPLVSLTFRGIQGKIVQEVSRNGGSMIRFDARLHSMGAVDLYQSAGNEFALLMSSFSPRMLCGHLPIDQDFSWQSMLENEEKLHAESSADLVAIEYKSSMASATDIVSNDDPADKLSIRFHELFLEWNPETLAAIQKAIRVPPEAQLAWPLEAEELSECSDEEFFDALEDVFFDAGSETDSGVHLISEVSSSVGNSTDLDIAGQSASANVQSFWSSTGLSMSFSNGESGSPSKVTSPLMYLHNSRMIGTEEEASKLNNKPFEFNFVLSKLRVQFNKESRHRRVLTAQMDGTSVQYATRICGGSRTSMSIGNLVFLDPASDQNHTIYSQILGLQSEANHNYKFEARSSSSLLEMEILVNPTARAFAALDETEKDEAHENGVTIDSEKGRVLGCNYFVRATFSPMRFVFLEQLWFEFMDYFFEGIIGNRVWGGGQRATNVVPTNSANQIPGLVRHNLTRPNLPGADAAGISFTKFDIFLDSPIVLIPITYRSPEFVRLEVASISVRNRYNSAVVGVGTGSLTDEGLHRRQWYNNCDVVLQDLTMFSWCGRELVNKAVYASVSAVWPTGPHAPLIIPKWNVSCKMDSLDISLRRSDYALFQNIISYNVGEASRNLDEWEALQNLSEDDAQHYQEKIMVHFGYDKKDVAPTTYNLTVSIPSLSFTLIEGESLVDKPTAVVRCIDLRWQLRKLDDLVVKQILTCDVEIVATSDSSSLGSKLLSFSKFDGHMESESGGSEQFRSAAPGLRYTSTSDPNGDNIKTLQICDASIFMVVPSWKRFAVFFQSLPDPLVLSVEDVGSSIQVGDRWYRIGGSHGSKIGFDSIEDSKFPRFSWISSEFPPMKSTLTRASSSGRSTSRSLPTFQLRVLLISPRIILTSIPGENEVEARLILRMQHMDFLHVNNRKLSSVKKVVFLDGVEVYTRSNEHSEEGVNSLIHPWSVAGTLDRCNGESIGDCKRHSVRISADVLHARAAYSDMATAIDVCLSVMHDARKEDSRRATPKSTSPSSNGFSVEVTNQHPAADALESSQSESLFCRNPREDVYEVECDGFELLVVDDSGRHFAGAQDLIILSLGKVVYTLDGRNKQTNSGVSHASTTTAMNLRLDSLDLFDCLQPVTSPFRLAASSRSGAMGLHTVREGKPVPEGIATVSTNPPKRTMEWPQFAMVEDSIWGFAASPALTHRTQQHVRENRSIGNHPGCANLEKSVHELIEVRSITSGGGSCDYHLKLRTLAVQWNPSTVIAIQRFLGRLRKESKMRAVRVLNEQFDDLISSPSLDESEGDQSVVRQASDVGTRSSICAVLDLDSLTVCLNKEHQNRRLVEATLSSCKVKIESSDSGLTVDGKIGGFSAWDADNYSESGTGEMLILRPNRTLVKVASSVQNMADDVVSANMYSMNQLPFLEVHYKTYGNKDSNQSVVAAEVPLWVQSHLAETSNIDDYLIMSVASLEVTYLRERTEEILDYLSNGLPGKGMGATSRAAKGFLTKRILTKSFLELKIDSPQVVVPQHENADKGFALKLGDVNVKSWFEEARAETQPREPGNYRSEEAEWWRILSFSLTGLSGGVYEYSESDGLFSDPSTKPIDLEVILRKPTVRGRDMVLRGKLSYVDMALNYSDYVLLRAIARDNVGRMVNTENWDNVEKAFWMEEATEDGTTEVSDDIFFSGSNFAQPKRPDGHVAYSSNARFVRYGTKGRTKGSNDGSSPSRKEVIDNVNPSQKSTTLDLRFELDGLALKLRRNDYTEFVNRRESDVDQVFDYDVSLLRVQIVEVSLSTNATGDMSFHLSLFRLGLFDLGDRGRILRERLSCQSDENRIRWLRQPCPFSVLAEGYTPSNNDGSDGAEVSGSDEGGPQLVVTVDRCPATSAGAIGSHAECQMPKDSKVTIARIVVNYLSVNALIRPFQEIMAFLSCAWPTNNVCTRPVPSIRGGLSRIKITTETEGMKRDNSSIPESSGLQLKLVAHYPRVFFLADESDAHSRALVLRGLAVINASLVKRVVEDRARGMRSPLPTEDVQRFIAVDAQLHRMESYINPDVDDALRFKRRHAELVGSAFTPPNFQDSEEDEGGILSNALGVALIQPVTTGVEYSEIRRELFPTQRALFVNIEPVSTMLSFEDLQLIEAVLKRWSSKRAGDSSTAAETHSRLRTAETAKTIPEGQASQKKTYSVVFTTKRLGLALKMELGQVVVRSVENAEHASQITPGDVMLQVDGATLEAESLSDVVRQLSNAKRPTTIRFATLVPHVPQILDSSIASIPPTIHEEKLIDNDEMATNEQVDDPSQCAEGRIDAYTLCFRAGVPTGLKMEKSTFGIYPVVSEVLPTIEAAITLDSIDESDANQFETVNINLTNKRVPRVGAVLVGVDGVAVEELGYEEILRVLKRLGGDSEDDSVVAIAENILVKEIYSMAFLEIESSLWGTSDSIDVSAAGITLSFIDDLKGRDMPLFRADVNAVEIHVGNGLGIDTSILDPAVPDFFKLGRDDHSETSRLLALNKELVSSFSVKTFSAIALSAIYYYHPRIAVWEPFLEPSQLYLQLECQAGSVKTARPGQLAVEISDRLLRHESFRRQMPAQMSEPQMVSLNLTDAATEVFVKASHQWKEWRNTMGEVLPSEADHGVMFDHAPLPIQDHSIVSDSDPVIVEKLSFNGVSDEPLEGKQEIKQLAAQKAAQAALVFAQKRGADTNKKGETAKPFVFRNRTGVSIAFAQQKRDTASRQDGQPGLLRRNLSVVGEYVGLAYYDSESIVELGDQEDAKFDMEMLSDQPISGDQNERNSRVELQSTNRVRNYEGRFPCLLVAIQAVSGVSVDPLEDLEVYKVGSTVHHLTVRKEADDANSDGDSTVYSIPVVWKVEIEDNRRILTLSSAVRIVSTAFATSFEIGVQKCLVSSASNSESSIRSVGVSSPESPFYLPLWLALKLEAVRVFVRPKSTNAPHFSWGRVNVLEFSPVLTSSLPDGEIPLSDLGKWAWKESFNGLVSIPCEPAGKDLFTAWLSCFDAAQQAHMQTAGSRRPRSRGKRNLVATGPREVADEVISVSLDSGLTLRNMLPINVEWEVAYLNEASHPTVVDGSSMRNPSVDLSQFDFDERSSRVSTPLKSGECTEVFACDYKQENIHVRFRGLHCMAWSNWASLCFSKSIDSAEGVDDEDDVPGSESPQFPTAKQVNVQVVDDEFGVPLTFGVRVVPKSSQAILGDLSMGHIHGIEIIVFAELWIRNLTTLPLNFGCPAYQMHFDPGDTYGMSELSVARFTAESALMEIASVLEFGDKGTGLSNNSAREIAATGRVQNLPNQECSRLVEEVFEYVEIENSTVKRRWWASESYDSYRENITESSEGSDTWKWIDGSWAIDSSGCVEISKGGWESCRNLFAGSGSFNNQRKFDPSHGIRRRRWFRARETDSKNLLGGGLQAFHQPVQDSFSREQRKLARKNKGTRRQQSQEDEKEKEKPDSDTPLKVSIKNGGGRWSIPVSLPPSGTCHGVVRVLASRWPGLTKILKHFEDDDLSDSMASASSAWNKQRDAYGPRFESACLNPSMFELCYSASEVEGDWGEFSRCLTVYPRFLVRNDSQTISLEVKQTGSADHTSVRLAPGEAQPFYWADFRLPGLASVRPSFNDDGGACVYRWSGGFDICNLGMCPVRVRLNPSASQSQVGNESIRSIRALVEIRPGTGGSGINISFREEDPRGDGSLFRVENLSTFPIWLAQDGVLANPSSSEHVSSLQSPGWIDGDLVRPSDRMSFALDVPFRQGKYAGRKAATMPELLRVRVALAPLHSRSGIESVKVIGLTNVGESVRLNPSKLVTTLPTTVRTSLQRVRVLGVVTNDGPTRVLKFCLMEYDKPDNVFGNPFSDVSYISSNGASASMDENEIPNSQSYAQNIVAAGIATLEKLRVEKFPQEADAKRVAFYGDSNNNKMLSDNMGHALGKPSSSSSDQVYSVRVEFSGFLVSIVDAAPSEIATVCLKNFNALSSWNAQRTTDASVILSIGWLQVDNHVPSAPFPVAVRPDDRLRDLAKIDDKASASAEKLEYDAVGASPLLMIGLAFAPKHQSGIVCLRSVTVAPRSIVIALDLAFLVRIQRFVVGVLGHLNSRQQVGGGATLLYSEQKRTIPFPDFESQAKNLKRAAEFGVENQKFYFESLSILPCNINLSVAPARALTPLQAQLEGKDTAAIHEAVRKGDVRVGTSSALFGVKVGRKNTTPLAVVRGVLKSIIVDALLRLDGASLNFSGVFLRNHISTAPQLTTYLLAHYLASLRHNVPALIGSLAAFGNPLGLIRGLGDGMSDFVTEPVKGLKKSVKELDPFFLVDGVARGTESLARHTVGGFADSASLLTETFSKNMAVLTLDRRYAQKRDRGKSLRRNADTNVTLVGGVESGFIKLVQGFTDGVTGVVKAPMRGAEKRGIEGFAKGVGKGLLGLLVKPMIGISDAATDVMIGVKSSVETGSGGQHSYGVKQNQYRPRRPMYGRDKVLRPYSLEDAAAATLMLQTRSGGENYLNHIDLGDRVALLSVRRILLLGPDGRELLALKFKHVASIEIRSMQQHDGSEGWGIVVVLNTPRRNGSDVEVVSCSSRSQALELYNVMQHAL